MYCQSCGSQLPEGANNCPNCGAPVNGGNTPVQNNQNNQNTTNNSTNMGPRPVISKRDLVLTIILSIVTCGLYAIYWFIVMTDDSNLLADKEKTASGGLSFVYVLLTCGIYTLFWYYKMGKKLEEAGQRYGVAISDNSILYLVLGVVGLGIVSYALIQNDLNKFATQ